MRRTSLLAILLLTLSIFLLPALWNLILPVNAVSASFSFAASGDMGSLTVSTSTTSLNRLATANPSFFLSLGDMSYDPSVTGDVWCGQFASAFSSIEVTPGDHDTGGHNSATFGETHSYERYLNGCPFNLGVPIVCGPVQGNCYGKEYYFDYPTINPVARFIFASPKIYNITGVCTSSPNCSSQTGQPCTDQYGCWQYDANDIHYNWAANAIDNARAQGIGWVVVATHKLCMSSADATCSMGISFFNMLVQKKVDLIIQAHDNAYERSKQLALNSGSCPNISTDGNGYVVYNSGCIVDSGLGNYTRGLGSVVVVQGAWVNDLYGVNASASTPANVAEAPFFAKLMGKNTPGNGLGFTKYTISASRIDVQTSFSGNFSDSFSISNGSGPIPLSPWPALVANPGTGEKEFKFAWERATFFAKGLYWAFWANDGTCEGQSRCLYYSTSLDGVTWSTPTNVGVHVNREDFSVTTDGTNVYYARYNETDYFASTCSHALLFRQGAISGGSINWQPENIALPANATTAFISPNLKLDSSGQAWIGYLYSATNTCGGNGTEQPRAIHSKGTNYGAWSSQTVLSNALNGNWVVDLTSLGNGAIYFTYWIASSSNSATDLHGRLYNSTFSPDQAISSASDRLDNNAFVFSNGSTVYAVWLDESLQRLMFASTSFKGPSTETWNKPVKIATSECCSSSSVYGAQPWTATFDPVSKSLYLYWYNYTNQEVDLYRGLDSNWSGPTLGWTTNQATSVSSITSFQYASKVGSNGAEAIGVMFMDGQGIGTAAGNALKYLVYTTIAAGFVTVSFTTNPTDPQVGQQVKFTASASGATPPYSYSWNFGDGSTFSTTDPVVTHTYTVQGTFLVTLNVVDAAGAAGTNSRNVSIGIPANIAPFSVISTMDGRVYKYFQNGTSVFIGKPVASALRQVAWRPDGAYALIIGDKGIVYTYDGTSLTKFSSTVIGGTNLNAVAWKPDGSYALIGGQNGLIFNYNGTAITKVTDPSTKNIYSISWNPNGNSALLVGDSGTALKYTEPATITPLSSGTGQPLFAVAWDPTGSYALTAGANDVILSCNGTTFNALSTTGLSLPGKNVRSIEFNPATGLGLLAGDTGMVLTYNGTRLAIVTSGTNKNLLSLSWFAGAGYIVGQSGTLLSYAGGTLTKLASGTTSDIASIAWTPQTLSVTFTYSPTNPSTQTAVSFTAGASGGVSPYSFNWNFGDGNSAIGGNAVHSYSSPGSYTVSVTVTDSFGSTSQKRGNVTVQSPQPPAVTLNNPSPNPASTGTVVTVNFAVSSPTNVTGITVNWGDGTPLDSLAGMATSDTHIYASTGNAKSETFTITVTATNAAGPGSGTTTETVNDRPPTITVSSATSPVNTGQMVSLTFHASDADGTISSLSVNWGDGTSVDVMPGTATSDSHIYTTTGSSPSKVYTITVTAIDNSGSTGQTLASVTVNDRPPIVSVTGVSPNPALAGQPVSVSFSTSDPDGTVSSIVVNWGDGSPSDSLAGTAASDTHTYASGGSFIISVTATDNSGSSSTGTISESVNAPLAPAVTINNVSPNPASTGQAVTVTFTVSSTTSVSGVTVNWGDGATDSLAGSATSDIHFYTSTGNVQTRTFTIAVTATNAAGSGSAATNVSVNDQPPTIALTGVSPNPANTGTTVTATFSSTDSDGTVSSISVNWGDGTSVHNLAGTATSDTHAYPVSGNFTITIVATDNSGSTSQATRLESVKPASTTPYALAVTADGKVYKTYANGTMILIGQPVTTELRQVSWKPDGSYALISGDSAVLLKYDGTQLTSIPTSVSTGYNFWTVSWKPDGSYALIGGTSGLLLKYDGVSVTAISDPNTLTIFAIGWNPTSNYALIVGKSGAALTYDGTSVRSLTSGTAYDLDAVGWNPNSQYALIGGLNGTILRFNGTQITPINTNGLTGTNAIASIAFNPSGTLALLVGNNGMVLSYNGSTLTLLSQVTFSWLYGVTWSPSGTAYIIGNGGTELTYSNGTLTKVSSGITSSPLPSFRAISWKPQ